MSRGQKLQGMGDVREHTNPRITCEIVVDDLIGKDGELITGTMRDTIIREAMTAITWAIEMEAEYEVKVQVGDWHVDVPFSLQPVQDD